MTNEQQHFESIHCVTDRKLGVGGYGTVFLARDAVSQGQLVCKIVDLKRLRPGEDARHTPRAKGANVWLERQLLETELLSSIRHVGGDQGVFLATSD